MTRKIWMFLLTFAAGALVGRGVLPSGAVLAQGPKPIVVTRLYTGADNETHADEQDLRFAGSPIGVSPLMKVTSAELHRSAPGGVADWHRGPRRQYVITLSGHGELEVSGGKKIAVGPGHIELIEDTTGKGHVTRVTGNEERVTLQLVLADQTVSGR